MKDQETIASRIREAIKKQDAEELKAIRSEIARDRWMNQWKANGSKMSDFIHPNPFVLWQDSGK